MLVDSLYSRRLLIHGASDLTMIDMTKKVKCAKCVYSNTYNQRSYMDLLRQHHQGLDVHSDAETDNPFEILTVCSNKFGTRYE